MGSNQSRPSEAAVNEKLLERLQALNTKDDRPMNEKDGFVVVDGEARMLLLMLFQDDHRLITCSSTNIRTGCKVSTEYICHVSIRVGEGAYG